jgi:hypothetical protein
MLPFHGPGAAAGSNMTIIALLIVCLLVAFPTTLAGKALRELLVDNPARWLSRVTPGRFAFYFGLGAVGLILFWLFGAEGVRLFSLMAPDLIVWFTVFDVSVFLDVLLLSVALTANTRLRAVRADIVRRCDRVRVFFVTRVGARGRAIKSPSIRREKADPDPPRPADHGLVWA